MRARERSARIRRPLLAVIAAVATLIAMAGLVAPSAQAAQAAPSDPTTKFTAAAEKELTTNKTADFWVRLADRADLSKASAIKDWDQRGQAVYDTLRKHAQSSQAGVVAQLKAANADFTPYWITNAVLVRGGTLSLATSLAAKPEVKQIVETTVLELIKPVEVKPDKSGMAPNAVEWGIATSTPTTSGESGDNGEGIVVASIDTVARTSTTRRFGRSTAATTADGTFDHNYNFFDVAGNCNAAGDPCDSDGHGTHTMGTMVGDDGAQPDRCRPRRSVDRGQRLSHLRRRGPRRRQSVDARADPPRRLRARRVEAPAHHQQLVGVAHPVHRPVPGGHPARLGSVRHLGPVVQRQQRPGLPDERLARLAHHQLLGRRL